MKQFVVLFAALVAFAAVDGQAEEGSTWGGVKMLLSATESLSPAAKLTVSANKAGGMFSTQNPILEWISQDEEGWSKVVRHAHGIRMELRASNLTPGDALTIWWVIFNEPGNCDGGCGEPDVFAEGNPAQVDVAWAAGAVVDDNGNVAMMGHKQIGDSSGSAMPFFNEVFGAGAGDTVGLLDPIEAEVHLVVRSHGPVIAGMLDAQTNSFEGGCTNYMDAGSVPRAEGDCADVQFAIHLP